MRPDGPILAFPHGGFLAHTVRLLEVAKVLRARGHEVRFLTRGSYASLLEEAGFSVGDVVGLDPEHLMERLRHGDVEFYSVGSYGEHVAAERAIFREVRPRCVLGDHRWSLRSSTEQTGTPYVSLLNASWTRFWSLPLRPYVHHPLMRALGGGPLARRIVSPILPLVAGLFKQAGCREQNRWRSANGLRPYDLHLESFEGDLNLLTDVPAYSPCDDLPPTFRYVGPLFWEPDLAVPDWLGDWRKERPLVYLSFGSTGLGDYFPVVLELLARRDVDVIVTTGGLAEIPDPPPGVRVAEILPGSTVLEKADLLVCHGGNGTIYQALAQGVPLVGIPTCITQEIEMDQVERLGCGIQINEVRFRVTELAEAIDRVLADRSYTAAAERAAEAIRRWDAPATAADEIERFME